MSRYAIVRSSPEVLLQDRVLDDPNAELALAARAALRHPRMKAAFASRFGEVELQQAMSVVPRSSATQPGIGLAQPPLPLGG